MQITFPQDPPRCTADLTVVFQALVDGTATECTITVEALEDHFHAASPRTEDLLEAFAASRHEIEAIARDLLHGASGSPVIHSGLVRFKRAQKE